MDYDVLIKLCALLDDINAEYMLETADSVCINSKDTVLYDFFIRQGRTKMFTTEFDLDDVLHHTIKLECNNTNQDVEKIQQFIQQHFILPRILEKWNSFLQIDVNFLRILERIF